MPIAETYLKFSPETGVEKFVAQMPIKPGRDYAVCVTISETGPNNIETFDQLIQDPGAVEISEEEFMDAYFNAVCAAMEGEYINDGIYP